MLNIIVLSFSEIPQSYNKTVNKTRIREQIPDLHALQRIYQRSVDDQGISTTEQICNRLHEENGLLSQEPTPPHICS